MASNILKDSKIYSRLFINESNNSNDSYNERNNHNNILCSASYIKNNDSDSTPLPAYNKKKEETKSTKKIFANSPEKTEKELSKYTKNALSRKLWEIVQEGGLDMYIQVLKKYMKKNEISSEELFDEYFLEDKKSHCNNQVLEKRSQIDNSFNTNNCFENYNTGKFYSQIKDKKKMRSHFSNNDNMISHYSNNEDIRTQYSNKKAKRSNYNINKADRSHYSNNKPDRSHYSNNKHDRSQYSNKKPDRFQISINKPDRSHYSNNKTKRSRYRNNEGVRSPILKDLDVRSKHKNNDFMRSQITNFDEIRSQITNNEDMTSQLNWNESFYMKPTALSKNKIVFNDKDGRFMKEIIYRIYSIANGKTPKKSWLEEWSIPQVKLFWLMIFKCNLIPTNWLRQLKLSFDFPHGRFLHRDIEYDVEKWENNKKYVLLFLFIILNDLIKKEKSIFKFFTFFRFKSSFRINKKSKKDFIGNLLEFWSEYKGHSFNKLKLKNTIEFGYNRKFSSILIKILRNMKIKHYIFKQMKKYFLKSDGGLCEDITSNIHKKLKYYFRKYQSLIMHKEIENLAFSRTFEKSIKKNGIFESKFIISYRIQWLKEMLLI